MQCVNLSETAREMGGHHRGTLLVMATTLTGNGISFPSTGYCKRIDEVNVELTVEAPTFRVMIGSSRAHSSTLQLIVG